MVWGAACQIFGASLKKPFMPMLSDCYHAFQYTIIQPIFGTSDIIGVPKMETEKIVPTERELKNFELSNPETITLIQKAQESDAADRQLTIPQALKKYKKAVFWSCLLSTALIMEGYDVVIINSFFGQTQFRERFGTFDDKSGKKIITPAWQSGLANSALVGQLAGLAATSFAQDRFGCRPTYLFFMAWMCAVIFIAVFAPSLSVLAFGEAMSGISWGTLTTTYACEIAPTVLRPFLTAYVALCWGCGILLSAGVLRAVAGLEGDLGWRLPFCLQWCWPLPLLIGCYFAPESPWNAVRRNKLELAKKSLMSLRSDSTTKEQEVEATLAYIRHTTEIEKAEMESANFLECFKGTNLRRTEINCMTWASQVLDGNPLTSYAVVFLEAAGFSEIQTFDINISICACFVIGVLICYLIFPFFGRKTIYLSGLSAMCVILITIGGLGFGSGHDAQLAIGILLVICTLVNTICMGPTCYPIVAETPSGRLRYKTIAIGRFAYNIIQIIQNTITPRMLSASAWNWGAKSGLFWAGTNLLCIIWCFFRLPETKDRTFGEIDLLFEHKVPARKWKSTKVDQFAHGAIFDAKAEGAGQGATYHMD
ncbi:MFS transporter, SP family, general alpha glucoside:H+ symporter [Exophiala aquamarina CBS 119918]|uniref:MFS transporter, SP family, general alpha glucoside:H+ symporter n=1 Tax=Exophiala aquamarina CBS 119918 TaxID=1182545 RepID=A0A072Q6R4_9EURO|nr:MFS transporter, SP family, general alpha glucoside:H+ symporter [Exophiala aquamarina CBS 119918]KEF63625.1 MFS transporter, SP family, general alpha glucoside:H+ symporter [Exophiala aquamarina CBS 119918]